MPDEKPTHAQREDALLLLAEKIGELSDRLEKVETEFSSQTAPLDAASATQQSALASLQAALTGIKALNFHVLDNNLGAVSKRLETVADQATKSIEMLETKVATLNEMRLADAREITHRFKQTEQQRTELAAKRDADQREFAQSIANITRDVTALRAAVAEQIQLAKQEFAEPKSFNPTGKWEPRKYARLDLAELNGTTYVSRTDDNEEQPGRNAKNWQTLARRGAATGNGGSSFEPTTLAQLTDAATISWDVQNPVATVTLTDDRTLEFVNPRSGGTYVLILKQDGSGSHTVTWPSSISWVGGVTPLLTTTASKADVFSFVYDGTVYYGTWATNFATS